MVLQQGWWQDWPSQRLKCNTDIYYIYIYTPINFKVVNRIQRFVVTELMCYTYWSMAYTHNVEIYNLEMIYI